MNYEEIERLLQKQDSKHPFIQITFKSRTSIKGLFLRSQDFQELGRKNFWRIVPESRLEEYQKTNDINLARIYNGLEFTRLELLK